MSGTLTVPGAAAFDLSGCFGVVYDLTYFTTNPAAYVERFDNINLSCFWEGDGTFVGLFAYRRPLRRIQRSVRGRCDR